jgi:hypothetical protein
MSVNVLEFLDLRSHVWGIRKLYFGNTICDYVVHWTIEQDLHSLSKKEATSVRIE